MARRALTTSTDRRLSLCTYDVTSTREGDKRRARLFDLLRDHGEHVQYSVFLCELTAAERIRLLATSREILHEKEDQLIVLNIGPANLDWTLKLDCLGKAWKPQVRCFIV
ncbi:MAG: CRISPR-associated endonuclease Cas2 [Verrucomicrobiales bacterium]